MKKIIIALLIIVLIAGCEPTPEVEPEEPELELEPRSECDSYSEGPRKVLCYAMEAGDITMCADIEGRFREECVIVLAEMVQDTALVVHCDISNVENYRKMCRALISEDIEKCFAWEQGSGLGDSLSVRDCIDLTSRKLRDAGLCELFKTRAQQIYSICGRTSDCEGQWIDGASENAEHCKYVVEEAIQAD